MSVQIITHAHLQSSGTPAHNQQTCGSAATELLLRRWHLRRGAGEAGTTLTNLKSV